MVTPGISEEIGFIVNDKSEIDSRNEAPMRVVVRSLSVLTILGKYPEGLSHQELCNQLEIPLASMHRILRTLNNQNFITRSLASKKFYLGSGIKDLAKANNISSPFIPPPIQLMDAARSSGETTFLTQLVDRQIICVSIVEGQHNLRLYVRVGQEMPMYLAASARSILAFADQQTLKTLISERQSGDLESEYSSSQESYLEHLRVIKKQGFDICDNELDNDVWAISAPIYNFDGSVTMAVTMAGASTRLRSIDSRVEATITILRSASVLSELRGFRILRNKINSRSHLYKFFLDHEQALETTSTSLRSK